MLGKSPERDREIDDICQMIRNAARAGIPALKYNMTILGVVRSEPTRGRGGAHYSTFDYDKADPGPAAHRGWSGQCGSRVGAHRVFPAARDPGGRGIQNQDGLPSARSRHAARQGLPRRGSRARQRGWAQALHRNRTQSVSRPEFLPGHGFRDARKPADEIFDVIRYFGARGKIFNVHFRNIKGGFLNFQETFPDDGDVNMIRAMRVYREVGYDGMLMPDHVPVIDGDAGGKQAFAYAYGYIQALIQMVNMERRRRTGSLGDGYRRRGLAK